MTREEILALFDRRLEAWQRRDARALSADHSDTCIVHSPLFAKVIGRRDIQASYEQLFSWFPDWEYAQDTPLVDADRVAVPFRASATHLGEFMGHTGSQRRVEIKGVIVSQLAGGQIVAEQRIYDFTGLMLQLGVLRAKPVK